MSLIKICDASTLYAFNWLIAFYFQDKIIVLRNWDFEDCSIKLLVDVVIHVDLQDRLQKKIGTIAMLRRLVLYNLTSLLAHIRSIMPSQWSIVS